MIALWLAECATSETLSIVLALVIVLLIGCVVTIASIAPETILRELRKQRGDEKEGKG